MDKHVDSDQVPDWFPDYRKDWRPSFANKYYALRALVLSNLDRKNAHIGLNMMDQFIGATREHPSSKAQRRAQDRAASKLINDLWPGHTKWWLERKTLKAIEEAYWLAVNYIRMDQPVQTIEWSDEMIVKARQHAGPTEEPEEPDRLMHCYQTQHAFIYNYDDRDPESVAQLVIAIISAMRGRTYANPGLFNLVIECAVSELPIEECLATMEAADTMSRFERYVTFAVVKSLTGDIQ